MLITSSEGRQTSEFSRRAKGIVPVYNREQQAEIIE